MLRFQPVTSAAPHVKTDAGRLIFTLGAAVGLLRPGVPAALAPAQAGPGVTSISNSAAPAAAGRKTWRSRLTAKTITALAVATACLSLLAGAASADGFSPVPGTGVHTFNNQFADTCKLTVGPVYDQGGTPGSYAIIGGITIQNCSRRHFFEVTVYEDYWSSQDRRWDVWPGSVQQAWYPNVYGFGAGRIVKTPHICGGPPLYWYTGSIVDEYDANGNLIREVSRLSYQSRTAAQAAPAPC
jgi:hypothetical protein